MNDTIQKQYNIKLKGGREVVNYIKARAQNLIFDNSDIITGSNNCGHQTSGNTCSNNGAQKFDNCPNMNHAHASKNGNAAFFDF